MISRVVRGLAARKMMRAPDVSSRRSRVLASTIFSLTVAPPTVAFPKNSSVQYVHSSSRMNSSSPSLRTVASGFSAISRVLKAAAASDAHCVDSCTMAIWLHE